MALALPAFTSAQHAPGRCPPYADGRKPDAAPIVDALDKNKDGKLSRREWQAAGAPEPSWNMFMQDKKIRERGYITREEFLSVAPPDGIDVNCDGKITLEEFLATKQWKMAGPPATPT